MLENDGLIGDWNKKNDTNELWRCWNWDFSQKCDGFEAWTKPGSGKTPCRLTMKNGDFMDLSTMILRGFPVFPRVAVHRKKFACFKEGSNLGISLVMGVPNSWMVYSGKKQSINGWKLGVAPFVCDSGSSWLATKQVVQVALLFNKNFMISTQGKNGCPSKCWPSLGFPFFDGLTHF